MASHPLALVLDASESLAGVIQRSISIEFNGSALYMIHAFRKRLLHVID